MQVNRKQCKGSNKAIEFEGCGNDVYRFRFGLCKSCYRDWALTTKEGQQEINKAKIIGKKNVRKKVRAKDKATRESLMTKSDWESKLQPVINSIARYIDRGHLCMSSQKKLNAKYDAGHYFSVGSTPTLRFNLHNIFAQSVQENRDRGGNPIDYIKGIELTFGLSYRNELEEMRAVYPSIKLTIPEVKNAIKAAREFLKELKSYKKGNGETFTIKERVELRREGNMYIGIYEY